MKISKFLLALSLLLLGLQAFAENRGGGAAGPSRPSPSPRPQQMQPMTHPMVINIQHQSSGFRGQNLPVQHPATYNRPVAPSYGQVNHTPPQVKANFNLRRPSPWNGRNPQPNIAAASRPAQESRPMSPHAAPAYAVALHHHPYAVGYVRKKLQKLGVANEPQYIVDRAEVIHTSRAQSQISLPHTGFGGAPLTGAAISPRDFNNLAVRNHMGVLNGPGWGRNINLICQNETQAGQYYWHHDDTGFNYCHYIDSSGYQWFGWYLGNQYFWTRNFQGRWWIYDSGYNRWCFWNNNFWWWQDPNHIGDLYCYNDSNYIPCNSSEDQIAVTVPPSDSMQSFTSPDGTRTVELTQGSGDAFLYDTAQPPSFDPVYLASGVQSVSFSDTSNGRPMQIMLTLSDGSYDMFDSQGSSYGPAAEEEDSEGASAPASPNGDAAAPN